MKCPACDNQMTKVEVGGVEVDVCRGGCGGIWFDQYEFKKFDEPHEEAGTELLEVEIDPNVKVDLSERRSCPKCDGFTMMRHFFSIKHEVEIDECAGCAGIWLDAGELNKIRSLFNSEEEKRAAANKVFDEMFGPELLKMKEQQAQDSQKARRFANMVKFICPSYYIPGKQDWGAF